MRDRSALKAQAPAGAGVHVVQPCMNARRRKNAALNEAEYRAGAEELCSYPRFVFVELTENCNFHCPMCRPGRPYDAAMNMPFHRFAQIAKTLFPYAEVVDLRGWGESLIYPDIVRALSLAGSFGPQLKIYTNLTVSKAPVLEALMHNRVITAVSFDAASAELFARIRGGANINAVRKNLDQLVSLRDALVLPSHYVYFSVIVQEANLEEIPFILRIASDSGVSLVKLFPLCAPMSDPTHPFHYQTRIRALLDNVVSDARALSIDVQLGATLHPALTKRSALFHRCSHPWTHCYVAHHGAVGFCDHLIGLRRYFLGALAGDQFSDVWNNASFRRLRRQHKSAPDDISDYYSSCRWCYEFRYSDIEHWLRPCEHHRSVATSCDGPLYQVRGPSSMLNDEALVFP